MCAWLSNFLENAFVKRVKRRGAIQETGRLTARRRAYAPSLRRRLSRDV